LAFKECGMGGHSGGLSVSKAYVQRRKRLDAP
jgi:hypothetical protein